MAVWIGWPMERIVYLFLGILFLGVFAQVTLYHWRQNFRHWSMWIPVVATPLLGLVSLGLVAVNAEFLRGALGLLSALGAVAGLVGSYYHVEGVGERVDGFTLSNIMVGPPLVLPLMITILSLFALFALYV